MLPETQLKPTVPELLDKLAALGSADQIALHFADLGILAQPCRAGHCAVAVYLQRATGIGSGDTADSEGLNVGLGVASIWRDSMSGAAEDYPLPVVVSEFVGNFDNLDYPGLVDWSRTNEWRD